MDDTKDYELKELAKSDMDTAIRTYIAAAEKYGFDDSDIADELEDVFVDCGKKFDVISHA